MCGHAMLYVMNIIKAHKLLTQYTVLSCSAQFPAVTIIQTLISPSQRSLTHCYTMLHAIPNVAVSDDDDYDKKSVNHQQKLPQIQ